VEPGVDEVHFRFSERISERPVTGNLNDAVVVSPSTGLVRVRHRRDGITVEMQEGFEAGRLYRVTVLPVINDMFQNRLRDPFDLVVSTGDDFVPNVLAGMVEDRVTGEAVPDVRVEARFQVEDDTITHWNLTDRDGVFSLRYVPDGPFEVRAWMDRNRDREVGESEPQTRFVAGQLDLTPDTSFTVLSLIEPDTTPARLASVTAKPGRCAGGATRWGSGCSRRRNTGCWGASGRTARPGRLRTPWPGQRRMRGPRQGRRTPLPATWKPGRRRNRPMRLIRSPGA